MAWVKYRDEPYEARFVAGDQTRVELLDDAGEVYLVVFTDEVEPLPADIPPEPTPDGHFIAFADNPPRIVVKHEQRNSYWMLPTKGAVRVKRWKDLPHPLSASPPPGALG